MISSQLGIDARFDRCGECCSEVFLWTCGCCWVGVSSSPCCSGWLCTASGLMAGRWAPVFFGVNCAGAFCLGYSALIGTRLRSCDGSSGLCSWDGAGSGASSECGESDWLEVSVPFCTGSSTADGADSDCEASSAGVVPASSGMASMVAWAYASAARAVSVAVRASVSLVVSVSCSLEGSSFPDPFHARMVCSMRAERAESPGRSTDEGRASSRAV